jgi:hypothetical protein
MLAQQQFFCPKINFEKKIQGHQVASVASFSSRKQSRVTGLFCLKNRPKCCPSHFCQN